MSKILFARYVLCATALFLATLAPAQDYYATPAPGGGYRIYQPSTGKTTYASNLQEWTMRKQKAETGFGGELSYSEFAQGETPVKDTVKAAAHATDAAAYRALNAAHYVPGWNRAASGIRRLVGAGSQQRH